MSRDFPSFSVSAGFRWLGVSVEASFVSSGVVTLLSSVHIRRRIWRALQESDLRCWDFT